MTRYRQRNKEALVTEFGGACQACGYNKSMRALHFHHLDPSQKKFGLAAKRFSRTLEALREEAKKCVLLCANCHAEAEDGTLDISSLG
jgi:hypothetical protein